MFKISFNGAAAMLAATVLSTGCGGTMDPSEEMSSLATSESALGGVYLWQELTAYSGTSGQCNGGVNISESTPLGSWTRRITLDTDSRSGGCWQKFSIVDGTGEVSGLRVSINFYAQNTGSGQCDNPGIREIPNTSYLSWSYPMGIDTDGNDGGCRQVWSLTGRDDVALDVKWEDTSYNSQCDYPGTYTVTSSTTASFVMDMDDRGGGCAQSVRLRKIACGDGICDSSSGKESYASCSADCPYIPTCGDGICELNDCSLDCEPPCGDGICEPGETCSLDCREPCPTGQRFCPVDPL
ncbi:hypothetical protein JRI60_31755 [Archangium violaceum]|uniref:hypothetical protein n=1 Tax=Archangium violaceum TaxID=83451 RepID=UPI001950E5C8|nr:hypothetical protein [Archangium violaceum]QRN93734.1 hypothetical protein JRI60_31755 [Archangium violaceum]